MNPHAMPLDWRFHPVAPIIRPGQLFGRADALHAGSAHVIQQGDRYHLFYWAKDEAGGNAIAHAVTHVDRPHAWIPRGMVLRAQPDNPFNEGGPSFPFVIPLTDQRWLMTIGMWGRARPDGKLPNTAGAAISEDAGETWRYLHEGRPVIASDRPWDQNGAGSSWVVSVDGRLRMYYTSLGPYGPRPNGVRTGHGDVIPRIGVAVAESTDEGLTWTKPYDGLIVAPRGFDADPYEYIASKPCILRDEHGWRMWVNTFGYAYRVRSLHSADGLTWTWNPSPPDGEMGVGQPGAFDDHQRSYPTIIRRGDTLRCWYTGNAFGRHGLGYAQATMP